MNKILVSLVITCLFILLTSINSITANSISISEEVNDELDQYQEEFDISSIMGKIDGFSRAQSFKPTKNILTKAKIFTATSMWMGDYPNKISFTIRKDLDGNNLVKPITKSFKPTWLEFNFYDLHVIPDETYYLVFNEIGGPIGYWCNEYEGSYERGEALYQPYENQWKTPGYDFCFKTYGRDGNDGNNPPEIPTQESTLDESLVDQEISFQFKSLDFDGDKVKIRVDWGDGTQPTESELFDSNEIITLSHAWEEPKVYWMQVTAIDEHGSESPYNLESNPVYIKNYQNSGPMKPELWGDTEGEFGKDFEFSAVTWDCDKNDIYYFFDFGDDTNSGWIGPYNSGETCTVTKSWNGFLFTQHYEISVVTRDSMQTKSEWSDQMQIKVYQGRSREISSILERYNNLFNRFFSL